MLDSNFAVLLLTIEYNVKTLKFIIIQEYSDEKYYKLKPSKSTNVMSVPSRHYNKNFYLHLRNLPE